MHGCPYWTWRGGGHRALVDAAGGRNAPCLYGFLLASPTGPRAAEIHRIGFIEIVDRSGGMWLLSRTIPGPHFLHCLPEPCELVRADSLFTTGRGWHRWGRDLGTLPGLETHEIRGLRSAWVDFFEFVDV